MSWTEIENALDAIRIAFPNPVALTLGIHEEALRIAQRYQIAIYDSLIAAAALEADCTVLFSEDLQDGQVINGRITIQNPF